MAMWIGTSGYDYPEWKGGFYPQKIASSQMLPYYAEHFPTVEINYTHHRLPSAKTLDGWKQSTPVEFKLTLKAPKRITHEARLKDCADLTRRFCDNAALLGPKLGVLLFQLAPYFKKDVALLDDFLATLPTGVRASFEFRHASWLDENVLERLRQRNFALCISDSERLKTPVTITADYGYFRLRDEGYTPEDIASWATIIRAATPSCKDVFVYFKHEDVGKGPEFCRLLYQALGVMPHSVTAGHDA